MNYARRVFVNGDSCHLEDLVLKKKLMTSYVFQ